LSLSIPHNPLINFDIFLNPPIPLRNIIILIDVYSNIIRSFTRFSRGRHRTGGLRGRHRTGSRTGDPVLEFFENPEILDRILEEMTGLAGFQD